MIVCRCHGVSASPTTAPLSSICSLIDVATVGSTVSGWRRSSAVAAGRSAATHNSSKLLPSSYTWFTSSSSSTQSAKTSSLRRVTAARASERTCRRRTKIRLFAAICSATPSRAVAAHASGERAAPPSSAFTHAIRSRGVSNAARSAALVCGSET